MKLTLDDAQKIKDFLENNYIFGWTGNVDNIAKDLSEIEIVGQIEPQVIKADSQAAKFCGNCTYLSVTEDEQNSHPEKKDDIHWCKLFAKRVLHFDKHPNLPRLAECELIGRR